MNTGIAFWKQKGRPASNGGVAQLGEHLPCKQGVKSSNLSISIRNLMIKFRDTYLENRILNRNELIIQLNIKTSEAMWSSDWSYGKQYNKFCKQPRPKDATLCIWGWESNPRESKRSLRSWSFSVPFAPQMPWNPQKCPYESKLSTAIFPDFSRFQIYLVKLIRAQGGCLGTKSRWKTW